jgi:alpha-mannosidase
MTKPFILTLLSVLVMGLAKASGDPMTDKLTQMGSNWVQQFSVPIEHWRFIRPDIAGGERPDFDDGAWQEVSTGFSWPGENTKVCFRTTVTVPATVAGQSTEGLPVRLDLGMDDDGEIYVDGQLKEAFHWDEGRYTLIEHTHAGQSFKLAVRGINGPGDGQFHFARIYVGVLPEFDQYIDAARFVEMLAGRVSTAQRAELEKDLRASENEIHFTNVTSDNLTSVRSDLVKALAALSPAADIAHKYDVFYIGHAHIDMNWLWPWTETIDVCHRTWNSAMNLMGEFPDFHFVQSQPGAYMAIEQQYPDEFARMQASAKRGQWDPVGGLWDESDDDMPSGEGLARSFLYGQQYFKSKFGRYAVTGWLPDSFGHSWQLPQIMQQAGIRYFYHTRCGNGMEFTWWESPDGSRVLKANTDNYDENVQLDQMVRPAVNETRLGLPQALVVFGVGDHGGGPTREQILRAQSFEKNPILPHVHFASADEFFGQLSRQPGAASLPVIDTDLQYTLEGCYTTHADAKKALRSSENNLYTAEVLSSLTAMMGQNYPVAGFDEAWKPVVFAQFHDITCGSAIHSTYDWLQEQLAPSYRFEADQTERCLNFLMSSIDTRVAGTNAIVVWNTLSFARDDVVRIPMAGAGRYHSVVDDLGRHFPAQAASGGKLVFVARNVPAFGHAIYFPQTNGCPSDGITLSDAGDFYEAQTPQCAVQISKATGAISKFYLKPADWNVFGRAKDGNALQLLDDPGNAWILQYTGTNKILTSEGAAVSVLDDGPVFARVRVAHQSGKSSYTQDIVIYGALSRVDIPTTVDWHEDHTTLKIRLPVNETNLEAQAQIPYGSIARPTTGQECPGQKWMDVSQTAPAPVQDAMPLDLSSLFNTRCADNFDGVGNAYPAGLLPTSGRYHLGPNQVPFNLPGSQTNRFDTISSSGQLLKLPDHVSGNSLYLLAACINSGRQVKMSFQLADGNVETKVVQLNDWVVNAYSENQAGLSFSYRQTQNGARDISAPHMWIVQVPLPQSTTGLILPQDSEVRIFAATIAAKPTAPAQYGLSVLNDCKYGFDISTNVFRLTALRSATDPDPHADQGSQMFTYSLYPHAGGWREGHTEEQALSLNIPLLANVTTTHPPTGRVPALSVVNIGGKGSLIVSALKHSEDGDGYILRFYEAGGADTEARIDCSQPVRVEETDFLERVVTRHPLTIQGNSITLPVGHNQIISLHLLPAS